MKIQDSKLDARQDIQESFVPLSCYISPGLEFPVATFGARAGRPPPDNKSAASGMMENCMPANSEIFMQQGTLAVGQIQDSQAHVNLSIDAHPACRAVQTPFAELPFVSASPNKKPIEFLRQRKWYQAQQTGGGT